MTYTTKLSALACLLTASFSHAEYRDHAAHVHGLVEFNIAQDGSDLLVEITAPGADVVGFEHAPKTDAEKEAISKVTAKLLLANNLFTLSAPANCTLTHKTVVNTLESGEHKHCDHEDHNHDEHKHHDHDEHDHDEHKHHDHDGHEHHDHDEHEHAAHGEFTIEYQYTCEDMSKLTSIDTQWFKHFTTTEKVSVNLLTDTQQSAVELTSSSTIVNIK
ncbi:hypothetical protein BCU68_14030 [Vibrio sp. 10N.286.49.B3]|uniref:zinc uptake protein ZrgA n=1 Tax=Vibrio sp. 10N.286.49.B3 TaxID=1880855 RepID=UPI000C8505DC|nr:DUF2796 domain-containing protein [Vibrio sp. 10N.286.49.B3]PMH42553.1 hypothetical protein BCU68_14030 [Vibrio sp. 10N.286.49.B3]